MDDCIVKDSNMDEMLPSGNVGRSVSTKSDAGLIKDDKDSAKGCGCGSCTPSWLQSFKGVKFFTFVTLFALISKVFASSYFGAVVSTLERQFNMDSVKSGFLLVINDMMDFIFVVFITHFGHRGHRPRWIGTGLVMAAIGSFVCTIPHLMVEYESMVPKPSIGMSICKSNNKLMNITHVTSTVTSVDAEEHLSSSVWSSVFWLMLGQILIGIGNTPLKPLSTTYIDDAVADHKTGFYVAMLFLATPIGAIVGYFTSFLSLKVHVDFDRVPMEEWPQIRRSDPRWIGAWWVGFVVATVFLGISSLPFFLFPKQMGNCRKRQLRSDTSNCVKIQKRRKSVTELIKGLLKALKRMATNPAMVFICLSASSSSAAYAVSGAFGIKYFVDEFGKSNSSASIVGIAILPVLILAYIVGGYVIKRWKLNAKQCALFGLIVDTPSCLMYFGLLFVGCPTNDVAGVSVPYNYMPTQLPTSTGNLSLIVECNNKCVCPEKYTYDPVCINNVTYVTPCHAGCTAMERQGRKMEYSNCTCSPDAHVQNGACPVDDVCNSNFLIAVLLIVIALGTSSLGRSADIIVTLRCVDKEDRSLALGIKIFIVNLLAFFPSPVYFGALLNWSCLEFAYKANGERGTCLIYDRTRYRHVFYGMYTVLHLCGLFCWFVVYLTVKEKNKGSETPNEAEDGDQDYQDNTF